MQILINISYIFASILFVFGIKMLKSAETARRGNRVSAVGMLLAVAVTLFDRHVLSFQWIAVGLGVGGVIGAVVARRVAMTSMPQMVALFNGFGGMASLLVGWAEYETVSRHGWTEAFGSTMLRAFTVESINAAIVIGGVTFSGSIVAYLKLAGAVSGRPTLIPGRQAINGLAVLGILVVAVMLQFFPQQAPLLYGLIAISLALGVLGVIPIGGGDMPVVIAVLNSLSGLAAAAAGFVILNNVLIVAGCLVGASGLILTVIMCKAMNRTLENVLFGGFGAVTGGASASAAGGEMKASSVADAYCVLEAAQNVVIVPGYGMAVAQAQHAVKELATLLEGNGAQVRFAVHPVAGRMPGHMNVLLAEADVSYDQLCETNDINPVMGSVDVAIVIGANDVVNPAALDDPSSPIYGMPIIDVQKAKTVFALKRGQGAGFSGLENPLFFRANCRMLYGDAKSTLTALAAEFKTSDA